MKIILDENISFAEEAFSPLGEVVLENGRKINKDMLKDADALITRSITNVNKDLLEGSGIKFVGTATIGIDHFDLDYLSHNNIAYASAAGCNSYAVAEYIFSAISAIMHAHSTTLKGKTIGVIGCGNIGTKVVSMGEALGLEVIKNDPPIQRLTGREDFQTLDEILDSDIITLHVPLNSDGIDKTYHLIDEKIIRRLKPGTVLINSSRGSVVDNTALLNIIRRRKDLITVLDVWENEPKISPELLTRVNIGTPHIAGYSLEGKVNGTTIIYNALCKFFDLQPEWNPKLPAVENNIIELNGNEIPEEFLFKIFFRVYPIIEDDKLLKSSAGLSQEERGKFFDNLRKNYRLRRELNNYIIKAGPLSKSLQNLTGVFRWNVAE